MMANMIMPKKKVSLILSVLIILSLFSVTVVFAQVEQLEIMGEMAHELEEIAHELEHVYESLQLMSYTLIGILLLLAAQVGIQYAEFKKKK
ncbi:hypothetical protein Amet_0968 [Alkaliphilus metalliredigens QYMF]|uniref:Uncharacterized protein n=1 Tax=Alkaliphilus metalliredigens (strain QYMF) TaxID=293826 RepID=A6TLW7_ALKMQ|nr:hypothetical protein [Alkaliphilus metalliredigens]ABR47185.1 hypothetical protein Amet_0968 [Alkaliphilus metalliredigens QYMF]